MDGSEALAAAGLGDRLAFGGGCLAGFRCGALLLYAVKASCSGIRNLCFDLGGAMGIRTPDLLHAIHTPTVAGCGLMSPSVAFTCGFRGWTSPGVA